MSKINLSNVSRFTAPALTVSMLAVLCACSPSGTGKDAASEPVVQAAAMPAADAPTASPTVQDMPVEAGPAIPTDLQSSPAQSGGECGIEATATVPQGGQLELSRSRAEYLEGWALDRTSTEKASSIYIKFASNGDASYFAPITVVNRPGLGIRLRDAARDDSGFKVTLDLKNVPAGDYSVQVAQRVGDKVLLCATGRAAKISD